MNQIGHYRIETEIGRGGMGVVYRAIDTKLGRPVAIKVMQSEATTDPERHRRFVREAQSASALNHPNIVIIYEIGEDAGTTFIAMELVDGTPLDRLLAQGPIPIPTALDYAMQIASALAVAHSSGIIHRDIKPANIVVTRDGRAKVLDFGLAKLIELAPTEATISAVATEPGIVMGTAAYMSPEQAEGRPVDARSDIFSFGAVLYEMLAGRRPFSGSTHVGVITSILRDQPAPVRNTRPDAPADVDAIIERALAKDPTARYQDASALRTDLAAADAKLTRPAERAWRRPAVLVPVIVLLLTVAGVSVWQLMRAREAQRVRREVIPQIERLQSTDRSLEAVRLAERASRYAPEEVGRIRETWFDLDIDTTPAGAEVTIRNYSDLDGQWHRFGTTPIRGSKVPFVPYRVRITKAGFAPIDISHPVGPLTVTLIDEKSAEPGMVHVEGGPYSIGVAASVTMPDFWIDKFELTNREFQRFVEAGGYADRKSLEGAAHRRQPNALFRRGRVAISRQNGKKRTDDMGARKLSRGKRRLPCRRHRLVRGGRLRPLCGQRTADDLPLVPRDPRGGDAFADILKVSNFDARGPVRVGERQSVGVSGTYRHGRQRQGVVRQSGRRQSEPIYSRRRVEERAGYRFQETEARDPWLRDASFGVRFVKNVGTVSAAASAPVANVHGNPASLVPVSDEEFRLYKRFYDYDRVPLDARVEAVDESPHWKKEKVSFAAAYGGERIPAYLFLPKNARPPYQTVVFFPTSYATAMRTSSVLDLWTFEFLVRSGRAVLYPVYQGTFERMGQGPAALGGTARRDREVQRAKDVFRAVDYLETDPEIDKQKVAYYSLSIGCLFRTDPGGARPAHQGRRVRRRWSEVQFPA